MSVFSKLHNLIENEESLTELAQNKDRVLVGASDEEIRAAVEEVIDERNLATKSDVLSEDDILVLIDEHSSGDGGLTTEEVVALIDEHSTGGYSEEELIELIETHSEGISESRVQEMINTSIAPILTGIQETKERLDRQLDELDKELSDWVIGPAEPSGDAHTNPGWGIHFTTQEPVRFSTSTIRSLTSGTVNIELFEYSAGDTGELVDSTTIELPTSGEHTIDLDIDVEEPGQYLLTRDYDEQPEDFVSLWRMRDYDGWEDDSDELFTLHGGGHNEYSDNKNWYYFFDLHVKTL